MPLIGHGGQIFTSPLTFFTSLNALGPLVQIQPGPKPVYVVTAPELVRRMLVTDTRNYLKGA
ncbi:hypothetical protein [Streptomyces durhamensis]|uniref:hypothetical protein n=1 Tax=Streptomyces durhamensis TaxID=68194 RepID=UPI0004CD5F36|nr:hypothetical protein [Streptomyces durhamensis]